MSQSCYNLITLSSPSKCTFQSSFIHEKSYINQTPFNYDTYKMGSYNKFNGFRRHKYSVNELHFEGFKCRGIRLTGVNADKILTILRLDHEIRVLAQREESLGYKARALKKTTDIEDNVEQKDYDSEIKCTRVQRFKKECHMFRAVTVLPPCLKHDYKSLRLNPLWYMREEMIDDCADQGGCCSRGCGCCARRSLSQDTKTRGHCTLECRCCASFRDPDLTKKDLESIESHRGQLMEDYRYSCEMANWYFRPISLRYKIRNFKFLKWKK